VGVVAPGRSLGTASHALTCSGSAAAQGLRVVWLVPVRSVASCPLAWPQRPAAGRVGSHGRRSGWARQVGQVAGELVGSLTSSGPAGLGQHQGQPIAPLEAAGGLAGHGVGACVAWWRGACRSLATALHSVRSRAQAAPLHRLFGWGGWCRCGRSGRWRGCPMAWPQRPTAGALDFTGMPGVGSPSGAGGWRADGVAAQLTPGRNGGHQGKPIAPFPAKGGAFRGAVQACAAVGLVAQSVARSRSKGSHQRSQPIRARPVAGLLARRRGRGREKEGFYICE